MAEYVAFRAHREDLVVRLQQVRADAFEIIDEAGTDDTVSTVAFKRLAMACTDAIRWLKVEARRG